MRRLWAAVGRCLVAQKNIPTSIELYLNSEVRFNVLEFLSFLDKKCQSVCSQSTLKSSLLGQAIPMVQAVWGKWRREKGGEEESWWWCCVASREKRGRGEVWSLFGG